MTKILGYLEKEDNKEVAWWADFARERTKLLELKEFPNFIKWAKLHLELFEPLPPKEVVAEFRATR